MTVETTAPATGPEKGAGKGQPVGRGYREDQGRLARMAAFWGCILLAFFGCTFLHGMLVQVDALNQKVGGIRVPVLGIDLTGAFLISLAVFVVALVVIQRWQAKPRVADLLIDTEAELRKVTWPTPAEVVNASMVVVACVLILFGFLAAVDWFLGRVMKYLLLGEV